jgi:diguanylate cyclase (GGDEF)-like protein/PAS domain S-box-containing protein
MTDGTVKAKDPDSHELTTDPAALRHELSRVQDQLAQLRVRLSDTEETLRAIRTGGVDAIVVTAAPGDERVFTLSSADRPYRNFVENMSDGAATVSAGGIVLYANQALADLIGSSCPQIVGRSVYEFLAPTCRANLAIVVALDKAESLESTLLNATGAEVPVLIGASSLTLNGDNITCLTFTDLTSERQAEAELAHWALHDAMTGLPNRTLLFDRIQHALGRRTSSRGIIALLFCDVDGFKAVNDAYGHHAGDDTLRTLAQHMTASVRPEDTVARIGGDEFAVLCEGLEDVEDAIAVASRIQAAVATQGDTESAAYKVTLSIGVALTYVGVDITPGDLLRHADQAMYKAKHESSNDIALFDDQLRLVADSRSVLLSQLHHAVTDRELRLHYQPILSLQDESIVGVEALLRWQHPGRGIIPADDFIPLAEHSGLITPIGAWVLRNACQQAATWAAANLEGRKLQMAVNVSSRQLAQSGGLVRTVKSAIAESGIDPTALVLEVTESALMDDAESALQVLKELKALGVRIAIDDFGTGYSSLTYLKRFPVDVLKIDRSFVAGISHSRDDVAIVHSVIDLADAFGISAVAEGIETPEHLAILRDLGCTFGQGFLWSPAMSAHKLGATGP